SLRDRATAADLHQPSHRPRAVAAEHFSTQSRCYRSWTMSVLRGLAAVTLFALASLAVTQVPAQTPGQPPPHDPADGPAPAWPSPVCQATDDGSGGGAPGHSRAHYRPRLLDHVGPIPPASLLMPVDGALVADV